MDCKISDENPLIISLGIGYMWLVTFSPCFQYSFCCWLLAVWLQCLLVWVFRFILLGICYVSWKLMFTNFIKFGKFPVIISSFCFLILSLLFFWYSHYAYFAILVLSFSSLILCSFFICFFLFLKLDNVNWPVSKFIDFFFLLPTQTCCWTLVTFSISVLYFLTPEFLLGSC